MHRELRRFETRALMGLVAKVVLSTCALGLVCWLSAHGPLAHWATQAFWSKLAALLVTIAAAGSVFVLCATLLGIGELRDVLKAVRRRLGRTGAR